MIRLVLAGAGGLGREVFSWAHLAADANGPWRDIVFIDDNPDALKSVRFPAVQIGSIRDYVPGRDDRVAITVGMPRVKSHIHDLLAERGARFQTLKHPSAIVGSTSDIGEGSILCPGAIVTANARLGRFVTLTVYATVGHDAVVSEFSTLSGHSDVTGGATLEAGVFLGTHAVVTPGVRVGTFAVIGAGAVVIRDVEPGTTIAGVPGRNINPGSLGSGDRDN